MSFAPFTLVEFPQEPTIQPVAGSARTFELVEDFSFVLNLVPYTLPKGFTTDFASIPQKLEAFLDNDDPRILRAALVHDQLCDTRGTAWGLNCSSLEAAEILRAGMAACGASEGLRDVVFLCVALEGPHWK